MRKQVGDAGAGRGAQREREAEGGLLSDLREVQCLICCLLHQMFIADPNIAKLVHFQVIKSLCYSTVISIMIHDLYIHTYVIIIDLKEGLQSSSTIVQKSQ